jgi:hypothetical protein
MWDLQQPKSVKLIIGILVADENALAAAIESINKHIGPIDLTSDVWPFTQTDYYKNETGPNILRQFVSIENLIDPGRLAQIKHTTNSLEQQLAQSLKLPHSRPVNLDPGFIEPSKLVLASTKNFSHRIYIGNKMYAEVTLMYEKGTWRHFDFTFPDFRGPRYHDFLTKVRSLLMEQLKTCH